MRISPSAKQISHRVHDEVLKPASFFPYLPFDVILRATEIAAVGLLPKPRRPIWDSSIWKILYTRAVSQQKRAANDQIVESLLSSGKKNASGASDKKASRTKRLFDM